MALAELKSRIAPVPGEAGWCGSTQRRRAGGFSEVGRIYCPAHMHTLYVVGMHMGRPRALVYMVCMLHVDAFVYYSRVRGSCCDGLPCMPVTWLCTRTCGGDVSENSHRGLVSGGGCSGMVVFVSNGSTICVSSIRCVRL